MSVSAERRTVVPVGELGVAATGTLRAVGLGSCVAVLLYDPGARIGGLAHALLPEPPASAATGRGAARYAVTAAGALVDAMEREGADRTRLRARLVGGASMFEELLGGAGSGIGARNVAAARGALEELGVPLHATNVGGRLGRSVRLRVSDGRVVISSVGEPDVIVE